MSALIERSRCRRKSAILLSFTCVNLRSSREQISPNQLVQSHTPLRDYVGEYRDEPVLVVGGFGESGRKIAESFVIHPSTHPFPQVH
jgi:ribonucleotide monophosphatase NagD (HAD superfamily)